jgi:hypothetical protein
MNEPHYIPYVNSYDLLEKAYNSTRHYKYTTIIDNRERHKNQPSPKSLENVGKVMEMPVHQSTAQIMNIMTWDAASMGKQYFTWQHCDAHFNPSVFDEFKEFVDTRKGTDWGIIYTYHDTLAAYNVEAIQAIGGWDSLRFPWYFLDNDIAYRLHTAGYKMVQSPCGSQIVHEYSSTIRRDSERNQINEVTFKASQILLNLKHPNGTEVPLVGDYV